MPAWLSFVRLRNGQPCDQVFSLYRSLQDSYELAALGYYDDITLRKSLEDFLHGSVTTEEKKLTHNEVVECDLWSWESIPPRIFRWAWIVSAWLDQIRTFVCTRVRKFSPGSTRSGGIPMEKIRACVCASEWTYGPVTTYVRTYVRLDRHTSESHDYVLVCRGTLGDSMALSEKGLCLPLDENVRTYVEVWPHFHRADGRQCKHE